LILAKNNLLSRLNTFDTLLKSDSFQTFTRLIEGTEIETTLKSQPGLTLFAPIDQVFQSLPDKFLTRLINAKSTRMLLEVLRYHLVAGRIDTRQLAGSEVVPSEQGFDLSITTNNTGLRINQARIVLPDIQTADGVIHGIDELLIPGEIALIRYLALSRSI
jgi:uncharacterized surface protein with fasciclin (FAS1) repeats